MNPRLAAARALAAVLSGKASLNSSLPTQLDKVEERDRGLTQDLAFGTARWQPRLALLAEKLLQKPFKAADRDVEALLLVGLYQLFHTRIPAHAAISETVACVDKLKKSSLKGLLNAVLRNAQRDGEEIFASLDRDPVLHTAHPRWLQKALKANWPEQWQAICTANNAHPPLILRANRRHGSRDAYLAELRNAGIEAESCTFSRDGIRLLAARDVKTLPGFAEGRVSVQDEAAQLAADLLDLAPGQRVLDACAAPGGKTAHLLEREGTAPIQVTALEIDPQRAKRIDENLARLGLQADVRVADAARPEGWWDGQPYDGILLDAPCTASGIVRRHPDVRWLRRESDVEQLALEQAMLLAALWPLVRVGGRLLYCTCSVFREEGSRQIDAFLAHNTNARLLPSPGHLLPQGGAGPRGLPDNALGEHDGFFYALLEKHAP